MYELTTIYADGIIKVETSTFDCVMTAIGIYSYDPELVSIMVVNANTGEIILNIMHMDGIGFTGV